MRLGLLLAVLSAGCAAAPQRSQILDAPVVPFDELFAPADTVRFDPSIIIGGIDFLDLNQEGDLLVTDRIGRGIHLFSSFGEHIRTYSAQECLPDDGDRAPHISRFLGKNHVATMLSGLAAAVFTADGHCVDATRRLPDPSRGFCTSGDSMIFLITPLPSAEPLSYNRVAVYSPELHFLRDISVEWPKFPALNVTFSGFWGRNIDCFGDGPYFTYLGSMDAMPARFDAASAQQRPEFYSERPRDMPLRMSIEAKRAEWNRYITTDAVFALTSHTRMVVYRNLDERWQPEEQADTWVRLGISVGSNVGRFLPRSTIATVWPIAAGYGYAYSRGDHERLPNGDVGNPMILRHRFVPPQDADD